MKHCIRFEHFEARLNELTEEFHSDSPLKHVVIDDALTEESCKAIIEAIPNPRKDSKSNDYIFAKNKFENPNFHLLGDVFDNLKADFLSERFATLVSTIYRHTVFLDPAFVGGGLHQGGERSFLDMHSDFNRHPSEKDWLRELNILLYLNPGYEEEFGGHLCLENLLTGAKGQIAPIANRLVIMLTKSHTLHGYQEVRFPEGQFRTSIAAYAYSIHTDHAVEPARSTQWVPTTGGALKAIVARFSPQLVAFKNSVFGSGTVKRAGRGPNEPHE